ncbi:hypothetical protein O0881_16680 [Janthinobacterium sp. SUN100]|uniref:hypothetical protein n=1 Tax=Janthinobacterium sp. SUN100 TaxID=3004101 RepID=UPI0025AEF967|nr:hypothetical protein [Janthinobacterium sp. SUN100]MDN2703620.1 hypothetical protein [Janthinobacterium sp. SUN100]
MPMLALAGETALTSGGRGVGSVGGVGGGAGGDVGEVLPPPQALKASTKLVAETKRK